MKNIRLYLHRTQLKRGGRLVLDIDDLDIPGGAFVGVIGVNGAGKSTFLKVCCGLLRPDRGTVQFGDCDLTKLSSWRKTNLRKRMGYIPQAAEYNADLPFTLREVVAMGRAGVKSLGARLTETDDEIIDFWIEKLGLMDRRNQTFRSLSGGEQQKSLIARAMAQEPALLMLDEPGANLDFHWKRQITDIIDRLHQHTGITVILVSHETNLLPASCRRIILLHEGKVLADDTAENVFASEALERAYQCRLETVEVERRKYIYARAKES